MFDRPSYKQIAKQQLKGRYLTPVLITLFTMAIAFLLELPTIIKGGPEAIASQIYYGDSYTIADYNVPSLLLPSLALIFVEAVVLIATNRFYIVMSRTKEQLSFSTFIKGFNLWLQGFLGFLWYTLWVFLWALLFYIPGIVKSFAYSQMFYILAEHPNVGVRKAMKLSMAMTKGYKGDLFVMELSFLGWMILAPFTLGILYFWLIPYMEMSYTNAYHALKAQALKNGTLTPEDFGPTDPTLPGAQENFSGSTETVQNGESLAPTSTASEETSDSETTE